MNTEIDGGWADARLPRVDLICRVVSEDSRTLAVRCIHGVPTEGATLDNMRGAPVAPEGAEDPVWVLVPAASGNAIYSVDVGTGGVRRTWT